MTLAFILLLAWAVYSYIKHTKTEADVAVIKTQTKRNTAHIKAVEKEQAKQAEAIARHEKRLSDLEFIVSQAEADIEYYKSREVNLSALLDSLLLQQESTVPGSDRHTKLQKQIVTTENQIHAAEKSRMKAEHLKATAKKEMAA